MGLTLRGGGGGDVLGVLWSKDGTYHYTCTCALLSLHLLLYLIILYITIMLYSILYPPFCNIRKTRRNPEYVQNKILKNDKKNIDMSSI